jgi:hypothetical protein
MSQRSPSSHTPPYSSRLLQCLPLLLKFLAAAPAGVVQQQGMQQQGVEERVVRGGGVGVGLAVPGVLGLPVVALLLLLACWPSPASWMAMSLSSHSS